MSQILTGDSIGIKADIEKSFKQYALKCRSSDGIFSNFKYRVGLILPTSMMRVLSKAHRNIIKVNYKDLQSASLMLCKEGVEVNAMEVREIRERVMGFHQVN